MYVGRKKNNENQGFAARLFGRLDCCTFVDIENEMR